MKFSLYPLVYNGQKFFQRGLYYLSEKYRVDLIGFFEFLEDKDYVVIKLDTPNMHENFPFNYKIGTDIDIVVLEEDIDKIKNKIITLNANKKLNCILVENDKNIKIRYQFHGFLNLQFDLTVSSTSNIYSDSLKYQRKVKNIKTPEVKYEIVIRAIEYQNKPHKKHHLNYIVKHKNCIDFDLFNNYGIESNTIEKIKNS